MKKDRPRSTQRRALGAALLSGVLGVSAIGAGIASGSPASPQSVKALASAPAAAVTFPSTTTTTATTAPPATVAAPLAAAPAPPTGEEVAIAVALAGKAAPAAAPVALAAPEPAPAPQPVAAPSGGSVEDAIATYFGDNYDKALRVARCESSLNPDAVSAGGGNYGLFQINRVHQGMVESMGYSWDQILDPYVNAAVARNIYDSAGGWSPWGCRGA